MTDRKRTGSSLGPLAVLFGIGLALRGLHLWLLRDEPLMKELFLDCLAYDQAARRILAGGGITDAVFFQDPFYPTILAGIYRVTGGSLQAVRVIQSLLGALVGPLLFLAGRELHGRWGGWIAGFLGASYPVFIFYDALIMKESIGLLLATAALTLLCFLHRTPGKLLPWGAAGLLYGLAVLTRGNLLLAAPLIPLWGALAFPELRRLRGLVVAGTFWIGILLPILPLTLHNWLVGGEPVLLTAQGGANFFLGNNPASDGAAARPPELRATPIHEERDFRVLAERAQGRSLSAREVSAYWQERGREFWRQNPRAAWKLTWWKFRLFWSRYEIPDNHDFQFQRELSWVLRIPLGLALLAPLAWAAALGTPRPLRHGFLHLYVAVYCGAVVMFHVYSRYRLAVTPALILLAAGFPRIWQASRRRQGTALAAGLVAAALALTPTLRYPQARMHLFRGVALMQQTDWTGARSELEQAVREEPGYADAYNNLGKVHYSTGRMDEARRAWTRALELKPDLPQTHNNLGTLAATTGRLDEAESHFRRALELEEDYVNAMINLARLLAYQGRSDEANSWLDRAGREQPDHPLLPELKAGIPGGS